jgi:plasmid stability protein
MSIRTTVTLDDDVVARVKRESQSRGASFRNTLNDLLRAALLGVDNKPRRRALAIHPTHMGYKPGLNYDNIESLLEYGEGDRHQ